ncbi:hypothetical protein TH66_20385 [Carbonactinospora thermoautotrophica]|uniref:Transcriptional regulator n=1 Tax=Carbonactinospora thermoautotrophica TaxID=1469144 RepID=A0A132MKG6_9ACTN|nr:hypothetical protein TH66_20385 [Carbonactinospora thermoautotrophica]KWX09385.1 hypothetical protein TR74_09920 [Carbonactinospora thermoautotrophica]
MGRRDATKTLAALALGPALTEPLEPWIAKPAALPAIADRQGTVTEAEVHRIETATRALRSWDSRFRLGIRCKAVVGQLNEVAELLKEPQPAALARRLFTVLAELAKIAASMSYDAGLHPTAQRYYVFALRASHQAGDRLFGANVLADMARQMLDLDRPAEALDLVRLALDGVGATAPGRVTAMLRTREAWAYATTRRIQAFHRAVGQAQEAFLQTGPEPYWTSGFDAAELHGVIGARYRDLAQHDPKQAARAVEHIQRALELRSPRKLRNRAFDLIGLARAYLVLGEPEQACAVGREALTIADRIGSGRVYRRLADLHRESTRFKTNPTVAEFRDELRHRLRHAAVTT